MFRVVCWLGTQSWRLHTDVGTRDRRCATDAQAAVDVGATTFGIARWQDRGLNGS